MRLLTDGLHRLVDGETRNRIAQLADAMIDQRLNQPSTEQTALDPTRKIEQQHGSARRVNTAAPAASSTIEPHQVSDPT